MEFQRLPTGWQKTAAFRRNYRLTEARIKLSLTTVPFVMAISNAAGNVFFPFFYKADDNNEQDERYIIYAII